MSGIAGEEYARSAVRIRDQRSAASPELVTEDLELTLPPEHPLVNFGDPVLGNIVTGPIIGTPEVELEFRAVQRNATAALFAVDRCVEPRFFERDTVEKFRSPHMHR